MVCALERRVSPTNRGILAPMKILRNAHQLARLVLVWFALSLGVAVASPIVSPKAMELVCSATGAMTLLVMTDDGLKELVKMGPDCPLCVTGGAPPPVASSLPEPFQPLAHVLQPIPAAHIASLTAAPPPARGPPAFF
jgi:hypothetical protein